MVFGKKKKEKGEKKEEESINEKTQTIEATTQDTDELTQKDEIAYYSENYSNIYGPADFTTKGVFESQICNLLFGILIELKKHNETGTETVSKT